MKTIRRFYFYLLSLISIWVVIWAVVNLLRTIFDHQNLSSPVDWLAGGIAFVVVGVPIFWLHWSTAQKDAQRDNEEATSRIRALFIYTMPFVTGIPITYALLAILNRLLVQLLGQPPNAATLGASQSHLDNLIALAANLIILIYFWRILQADWQHPGEHENLQDFSRLHRFIWMVYGLGLVVFGAQQILRFIFLQPSHLGRISASGLATGLTLVLVGLPIWWRAWSVIKASFSRAEEQKSTVRLVVFFLLTFLGFGFSLSALGILLTNILRWVFRVDSWQLLEFVDHFSVALSVLISLGVVWRYYRRELKLAISAHPGELQQAALNRIYTSILSFAGLVITFLGLILLSGTLIEDVLRKVIGNNGGSLSNALTFLIIGVPLYLRYWQPIQKETDREDEIGKSARKSLLRRGYLYLALFATVVGTMISSGWWLYGILKALLGFRPEDFWFNFFMQLRIVLLFAIFLAYHLQILRKDGRRLHSEKEKEHSHFSILLLLDENTRHSEELVNAIQQRLPTSQLTCSQIKEAVQVSTLPLANLLILPATLATRPPELLEKYLEDFQGKVLVFPQEIENWHWVGAGDQSQPRWLQETAMAAQHISKNQPLRSTIGPSPWVMVAYIFAILFLVQIVLVAVVALVSLFSL